MKHVACGPDCAAEVAVQIRKKQQDKARREERAKDRKTREERKDRGELIAEAQQAFNELVRFEDADKPCISCGTTNPIQRGITGGVWDAGHYWSRGHAPHLRFDRRNVHKQCKGCNRPGGCTRAQFAKGMEARIGAADLAELDAAAKDATPVKWTKDELREMRDGWRKRLSELKKAGKD